MKHLPDRILVAEDKSVILEWQDDDRTFEIEVEFNGTAELMDHVVGRADDAEFYQGSLADLIEIVWKHLPDTTG